MNGTRIMTMDDLPWITALCRKRYPHDYDEVTITGWLLNKVFKEPHIFLGIRTDDAFLIATIFAIPWMVGPVVDVLFVCADQGAIWQASALLRSSLRWGEKRRAARWRLSSDTDFELGPLARRLGAAQLSSRYEFQY